MRRSPSGPDRSYRTILEHAGIAIAVLEGDLTVSFANLEFLRLFERSPEAVEGKNWAEVVSAQSAEAIMRLAEPGPETQTAEYEIPWVGRDGHNKQILAIVSTIPEHGGYVACLIDVTSDIHAREALWESEDRFKTVFEGAAVGMSLVDPREGKIIVTNAALQRMLGYNAKELSRMRFTAFTHPDDVESQWASYREMVAGKLKRFEMKKRYIRKDGTIVWARLVATLALTTSGTPAVIISMIEQIP
jgi:PAS domain S-box-containing protein